MVNAVQYLFKLLVSQGNLSPLRKACPINTISDEVDHLFRFELAVEKRSAQIPWFGVAQAMLLCPCRPDAPDRRAHLRNQINFEPTRVPDADQCGMVNLWLPIHIQSAQRKRAGTEFGLCAHVGAHDSY